MNSHAPTRDTDPSEKDVRFLEDQIYAYNFETTGVREGGPLAYFSRDDTGGIRGGVSGYIWGDCYDIRALWVRADLRGQGLGTQLMQAAEDEAARRGCRQVVLDTHSFQAPEFYKKRGFEVVGLFENYPGQHQKLFLRKLLAQPLERANSSNLAKD